MGSEMCIRDSGSARGPPGTRSAAGEAAASGEHSSGVELVGSAALGVLVASGSPSCGIVVSGCRFTAAAKRRCWWYLGAATASAGDLLGAAPA